jgi:hypothetical protein
MSREVEKLVENWRKKAHDMVPPEYADRDMHYKYLKLDNAAAGIDECADELEAALRADAKNAALADLNIAAGEYAGQPQAASGGALSGGKAMIADDLKRLEIKGEFAEGYKLYAWDADAEEYMPVTGYLVSANGMRVELQTDSDGEAIDAQAEKIPIIHGQAELSAHDQKVREAVLEEAAQANCYECCQPKYWHPPNEHGDHLHIAGHQDAIRCKSVAIRALLSPRRLP